jgi:transcriptional regulator GlxA family with amidase domain
VVVVGGILRDDPFETPRLVAYLREVAAAGVCLVGLCTGSLTLARAGLMEGRPACVSWFHHNDYAAEFPRHAVVSDRLYLDAGDRITSAGGVSVVHLASWLVERHCGPGAAEKGLRIMIEEQESDRGGATPQPATELVPLRAEADSRVRRALLAMDRGIAEPLRIADLAAILRISQRQLSRLFLAELGRSPAQAMLDLRLARARRLIRDRNLLLSDVAAACGFADSAHLAKWFRATYSMSPTEFRHGQQSRPLPERQAPQAVSSALNCP